MQFKKIRQHANWFLSELSVEEVYTNEQEYFDRVNVGYINKHIMITKPEYVDDFARAVRYVRQIMTHKNGSKCKMWFMADWYEVDRAKLFFEQISSLHEKEE